MARTWQRWVPAVAVPAAVAAAVIGGTAVTASADLPERSPQEVLELAAASDVQAFSGEIEQSADLGLPDLTALGGGSGTGSGGATGSAGDSDAMAADALELLSGSHTARIYAGGEGRARVQLLDRLAERDLIVNGDELWLYDSSDSSAVHITLPDNAGASDVLPPADAQQLLSPAELASRLLAAVDPSTAVSLGAGRQVAGRDAYELVLTPRADDTLVGDVSIAVDAESGLPLAVEITAEGATDPAFAVAFTSLSLEVPSDDLFAFTPPEGTDVTEKSPDAGAYDAMDAAGHPEPAVIGEGWGSVVAIATGAASDSITSDPLFAQLTTPVDSGSVLETSLLTVLLTDDGRVLAGAVPASVLEAAAASAAPAPAPAE
jgi:outer membrane lipoprotein-sorting protein